MTLAGVTERGSAGGVEANREATAIAALFPRGSRAFVGRDATREAALGARARFVHFATMGRVSDTSPMRSKLFFAPSNSKEDALGTLDVADFSDWDPQAEVVALSRIENAVTTTGEGATALSWALFATGAHSVVLSNWSPEAAAGSRASVGLFSRLQSTAPGTAGARTAAALREATLSLLQTAPYRHPHYWANLSAFCR